jgi:hypothetical protein
MLLNMSQRTSHTYLAFFLAYFMFWRTVWGRGWRVGGMGVWFQFLTQKLMNQWS